MYTVFGKTYREPEDLVPPVPPAARRLKPGERLRIRRTDRGLYQTIERRGASSAPRAAASSPRPKTPRPGLGSLAGPAPAGGGERYRWVDRSLVPYRVREAVRSNVLMMRDELGLSFTPEVRYFRPCRPDEPADLEEPCAILGRASYVGRWVAIRSDLDTWEAGATVRHEMAHMIYGDEDACEAYARILL